MQSFNKAAYEEDVNTIAKYMKKIFDSMKCSVEGHRSAPTTFCHHEVCDRRLLCPECLTKDHKHVLDHKENLITVAQYLEQILVTNMEAFSVNQYKIQELHDFYDTMWKGLQLLYKVCLR